MVVLAGTVVVGALLVGPLRGDGAALDTCTAQGIYSFSVLADAGSTVQALGFLSLTPPNPCTGLGVFLAEVDVKPLNGATQHLTFAGTYFVDANGVFTTNDPAVNLTGLVTQVAGGIANSIVFVANFGAAFSFGAPVVLAGVAERNPPVGFIGPTGAQGLAGLPRIGIQGIQGATGATGDTGATGPEVVLLNGGTTNDFFIGSLGSPGNLDCTGGCFFGPGKGSPSTFQSNAQVPMPAGTATRLLVFIDTDPDTGPDVQNWNIRVCVNATCGTGLSCTITEGDVPLQCEDTGSLAFADQDLLSVRATAVEGGELATSLGRTVEYMRSP